MEIPNFRASELALGFHCKKQIRKKFVFALPEGGMLRLALKRRMELLSDPRHTGRFLQKNLWAPDLDSEPIRIQITQKIIQSKSVLPERLLKGRRSKKTVYSVHSRRSVHSSGQV
jgi:hypothetical protein